MYILRSLRVLLLVFVLCFYYLVCFVFVFFFKQKTAYEMRISDWSSDVCSSDLGGDMGARIRSFDWAATSIGPPERWPTALRVAINICLHSSLPTAIYWGPELRLIYNDAWAPIPAERHPWAPGQPARAGWSAIWAVLDPPIGGGLRTNGHRAG